jgi:CheY-like chemotaxis protein
LNLNVDYIDGKKVVLLEDNFEVAQELEALLSSWGMDVTHVLSAQMLEEACLEEGTFDLIIADYHLGLDDETGMDSIRLLKQKQTTYAVQSVLISGDTSIDLAQMAKQEDVLLLPKPIRPARFRVLLNQLLAKTPNNP